MPSPLKLCELLSIFLCALVAGMFFGPWAALSISMKTFKPEAFLAIVDRMNRNMGPLMTVLMPACLAAIVPVLLLSYRGLPRVFYLNAIAFVLLLAALAVTLIVEVPIVKQVVTWTISTLPANWQRLRDRWSSFHVIRVAAGLVSFVLLLTAAIF
ncbi:MAG: DUF1772 domain-containing protein [Acidobacteriota bacterium]|nr:DUF1772 domain-containing protein [Acidobacteriota bacterium]